MWKVFSLNHEFKLCANRVSRFIASPFGYGVRLLGFSETGADLSGCVPTEPVRLYELGTKLGHNEVSLVTILAFCGNSCQISQLFKMR